MNNYNLKLLIIFGCGIFIILFLGVFRPFDMEIINVWYLLGYGLITILNCLLFYILIPKYFHKNLDIYDGKWYEHLPYDIGNIVCIGIGNFLFSGYVERSSEITWIWFWRYQAYTLAIGLMLSSVIYLVVKSLKLIQRVGEVESMNESLQYQLKQATINQTLVFDSETRNEKLVLQSNDLICIKAEGNYSSFYYNDGDKVVSKLLRLSLKNVESIIETSSNFSRSHRSYIININKIVKINSVGANYQIWVDGLIEPLPASRQNISDLKKTIETK